ncbi:MAG TPA: hypothetical protein VN721_05015 [Flavipsychrobacter sp.]|nr:hypothetical protein [Flavipsychrobacter sp.]
MLSNQTLNDLDIVSYNHSKACLFDKLNHCKTKQGQENLRQLCYLKDQNIEKIQHRTDAIKYMAKKFSYQLTITEKEIYYTQQYLQSNYSFIEITGKIKRGIFAIKKLFVAQDQYYFVLSGLRQTLKLVYSIQQLYYTAYRAEMPFLLKSQFKKIQACLDELRISDKTFSLFLHEEPSPFAIFEIDNRIRRDKKNIISELLNIYAQFEALHSLATAHNEMKLTFPVITNNNTFSFSQLSHPLIQGCIPNTVHFDKAVNTLLITGPNMAGKSTFMKSIGLAFFMSYLGIGVAAESSELPYIDLITTSMNVEDDIGKGYSYFFNEVQNVKNIASVLQSGKRMLVIADELFKGTNIKDAYDCSELVLNGFIRHSQSIFIISTHITELAENFSHKEKVALRCFDGTISENDISFTYKLKDGISTMRLGAYILKLQGVQKLLNSI